MSDGTTLETTSLMLALGTKHPLSALTGAGLDNLNRLGLFTTVSSPTPEETRTFGDIAISAHAPIYEGGRRLNIAATDDEFRQVSIKAMLKHVELVSPMPKMKLVNIHCAPKQWASDDRHDGSEGDYGLPIDGIRQIAALAEQRSIQIVLKNDILKWPDPGQVATDQAEQRPVNEVFGVSPEEWVQICEDVDRPNVALCLDTAHICTYAHKFPRPDRHDVVMAYLAEPRLIRHVHWNNGYLYEAQGRHGYNALIGKGSLPVEFHQAIKGLDAHILLEHFYAIEELEQELEYIAQL